MRKDECIYNGANGTVRMKPGFTAVGVVCGVICAIIMIMCITQSGEVRDAMFALYIMGPIELACLYLILAGLLMRINYDLNGFTYRNMLGISRRYDWAEVEGKSDSKTNITVFVGGRRIRVGEDHIGVYKFLYTLNKRYKSIYGTDVPIDPRSKKDLFKGHVEDAEGIIAVFVLLVFFFSAINVLALSTMKYPEQSELSYVRFTADSYRIDDSNMYIESRDTQHPVRVAAWEEVIDDPELFTEKLEAGEEFAAGYIHSSRGKKPNEEVWELTGHDGTVYISYSDNLLYWQENDRSVKLVLLGMDIFIILIIAGIVIVGRNPNKFSPRVVRAFFKEGSIH